MIHAPVAAPPPDDMEPQNVSFIDSSGSVNSPSSHQYSSNDRRSLDRDGNSLHQQQRTSLSSNRSSTSGGNTSGNCGNTSGNASGTGGGGDDDSPTTERLKRLSIGSGSRTYRITGEGGSPTRPTVGTKTFRVPTKRGTPVHDDADLPQPRPHQRSLSPPYRADTEDTVTSPDEHGVDLKTEPLADGAKPDKGFYISFDADAIIKPKPQLRTKKFTRKSSTPSTPASTPSKEDFPVVSVSVKTSPSHWRCS